MGSSSPRSASGMMTGAGGVTPKASPRSHLQSLTGGGGGGGAGGAGSPGSPLSASYNNSMTGSPSPRSLHNNTSLAMSMTPRQRAALGLETSPLEARASLFTSSADGFSSSQISPTGSSCLSPKMPLAMAQKRAIGSFTEGVTATDGYFDKPGAASASPFSAFASPRKSSNLSSVGTAAVVGGGGGGGKSGGQVTRLPQIGGAGPHMTEGGGDLCFPHSAGGGGGHHASPGGPLSPRRALTSGGGAAVGPVGRKMVAIQNGRPEVGGIGPKR